MEGAGEKADALCLLIVSLAHCPPARHPQHSCTVVHPQHDGPRDDVNWAPCPQAHKGCHADWAKTFDDCHDAPDWRAKVKSKFKDTRPLPDPLGGHNLISLEVECVRIAVGKRVPVDTANTVGGAVTGQSPRGMPGHVGTKAHVHVVVQSKERPWEGSSNMENPQDRTYCNSPVLHVPPAVHRSCATCAGHATCGVQTHVRPFVSRTGTHKCREWADE